MRALTGWSDTQLRVHLQRLSDMEYLTTHSGRRGKVFDYELRYDGGGQDGSVFLMGLLDIEAEKSTSTTPTSRGGEGKFAGSSRPQNAAIAGGSRPKDLPGEASAERLSGQVSSLAATTHVYQGGAAHPVVPMFAEHAKA